MDVNELLDGTYAYRLQGYLEADPKRPWPMDLVQPTTSMLITAVVRLGTPSPTASATVASSAGLQVGQLIEVTGIGDAEYNGVFKITGIPADGLHVEYAVAASAPASGKASSASTLASADAAAALDAWIPQLPATPLTSRTSGLYPYCSLGLVTFDGHGKLSGSPLALNMGGRPTAAKPLLSWSDDSNYQVDDDGRWGDGQLLRVDRNKTTHELSFRFAIADYGRMLEFVITKSGPRRVTASGTMTLLNPPLFWPLYVLLQNMRGFMAGPRRKASP